MNLFSQICLRAFCDNTPATNVNNSNIALWTQSKAMCIDFFPKANASSIFLTRKLKYESQLSKETALWAKMYYYLIHFTDLLNWVPEIQPESALLLDQDNPIFPILGWSNIISAPFLLFTTQFQELLQSDGQFIRLRLNNWAQIRRSNKEI